VCREEQMSIEEIIFGLRQHKKEMGKVKRQYASIPQVVTAIQWKGNNLMEVHKFIDEDVRIKASFDLLAIGGDMIVPKNHYIVRHSDGDLMVCPEKTFLKRYIPAEVRG
jgi:hypothetical protein